MGSKSCRSVEAARESRSVISVVVYTHTLCEEGRERPSWRGRGRARGATSPSSRVDLPLSHSIVLHTAVQPAHEVALYPSHWYSLFTYSNLARAPIPSLSQHLSSVSPPRYTLSCS